MGAGASDAHAVKTSRLLPAEFGGFLASAVLFGSLFLPWFSVTGNGAINGLRETTLNAWQTFGLLDFVLTAACLAPFVLAYIVASNQKLTWRPGEITMIIGLIAVTLILLNGFLLGKPGEPDSTITNQIGWYIGLLGALGIGISGFFRQAQSIRGRRPPGVF